MSSYEAEAQPAQMVEDDTQEKHTEEPLQKSGVANSESIVMAKARFREGQLVHMGVIQGGQRVKGNFTVHRKMYNRGGWVDYQLIDELTGQLYRHGAGVREKDLKPQ
ncbi:hypothetical protein N0V91_005439 [Didymella pomorum]|uniref:Uncharacterized protein n=1 Tax=Didymella pomorum TaxID=749634 RepID=A0A9W8ZF85_9PLEO|nr:hypothetical protein N0V91_005439 [Didymella pomorum]